MIDNFYFKEDFMRKLIFGLVAVLVTISLANAWSIEKKEYTDSGIKYHGSRLAKPFL